MLFVFVINWIGFQTFCSHVLLVRAKFSSLLLTHVESNIDTENPRDLNGEKDMFVSL